MLEGTKRLVATETKVIIEVVIKMINTILQEMTKGNFSFLILVVGIAQLIVMFRKR